MLLKLDRLLLVLLKSLIVLTSLLPPHGPTAGDRFPVASAAAVLLGFDFLQATYTECEQNRQLPEIIVEAIPFIIQKV